MILIIISEYSSTYLYFKIKMMRKILIPVDFSNISKNAVKYAVEIGKRLNAELVLIHLISTPIVWKEISLKNEDLYPEVRSQINSAKDTLNRMAMDITKSGVDASYSLIYDSEIGELHKYINADIYQLIVMGTNGEVGMEQIFGSNTFNTLKHSSIPVLAIRENNDCRLLNEIIIASDFQEDSKPSFDLLFKFALSIKLRVKLLYVNVPYNFKETPEIELSIQKFMEDKVVDRVETFIVNALNEKRGIAIYLAKEKPDLIATITHGRSVINNLFSPSITESLLSTFSYPVLSINMNPKS